MKQYHLCAESVPESIISLGIPFLVDFVAQSSPHCLLTLDNNICRWQDCMEKFVWLFSFFTHLSETEVVCRLVVESGLKHVCWAAELRDVAQEFIRNLKPLHIPSQSLSVKHH